MAKLYNYAQTSRTGVQVNPVIRIITRIILQLSWFISPVLVKNVMLRQFFAPKTYKATVEERDLLSQAKHFTLHVNDKNIQCWQWGSGPAVIFAHGWNGSGIQFKSFFPDFIAAGYRVVVFDGPGHGISDGRTSSYFEMTDTVRGVLRYCQDDGIAALVGHSFGASAIINALSKENYQIPAVLLAPALHIKEMLDQAFLTHGVPEHVYNKILREYENRFGYKLNHDNPRKLLPQINQRVLIIHDRDDRVTPIEASSHFAGQHKNIQLFATEALGHKRILFDHRVVQATLKFISPPE